MLLAVRGQYAVFVKACSLDTQSPGVPITPTHSPESPDQPLLPACLLPCLQEDPNLTSTWKKTMKVAVTGAAGQISNHLLFMLASGEVFGRDQPIALQLLGSERSRVALEGVAMELEDRWAGRGGVGG